MATFSHATSAIGWASISWPSKPAPADPSQAALVAGLYVTPRSFVSYGIGLFDPVNVFRIRYAITSNLELVTKSSSESTGADIIYTFERGR